MTQRLGSALACIARGLRAMLGVPDYERYVALVRSTHPDRELMPRETFMNERMENRYNKPGSRCC